jgi:hypothetical protein
MKTILILPVHSCVNLITNSSSELFICGKEKTQGMIKPLIEVLYLKYWEKKGKSEDAPAPENLWDTVLQDPIVAQYSFLPGKMAVQEKLETLRNTRYSNDPEVWDKERAAVAKLEAEFKAKGKKVGYTKKGRVRNAKDQKEFDKAARDIREKVWEPTCLKRQKLEHSVFVAFLKANKIDPKSFPEFKPSGKMWTRLFDRETLTAEQNEAFNFFEMCVSCELELAKGQVLIHSTKDNSIPWEFMETLEMELGAVRRHLG